MSKASYHSNSLDVKGVIGIDEVGRGPLAGPVTLCALYLKSSNKAKQLYFKNTVRDSKRINKALRYKIYKTIRKNRELNNDLVYSIKSCSAKYIDRNGINKAINQCLLRCMKDLQSQGVNIKEVKIRLDAGLKIDIDDLDQKDYIKGDESFPEIALASILAKETRDEYMRKVAKVFPDYFWHENVGYGTKKHRQAIFKYGVTKYHRRSFLKNFGQLDNPE